MVAWERWNKFDKGTQNMMADAFTDRFLRFQLKLKLASWPMDITDLGWVNFTLTDPRQIMLVAAMVYFGRNVSLRFESGLTSIAIQM